MRDATGWAYGIAASILGAWLVTHDAPLIPILAGIVVVGCMMIRLGQLVK